MFTRYATDEEICSHLAKYKVGDTVRLLCDHYVDSGIVRKGSKAVIRKIGLYLGVDCPKILFEDLTSDKYIAGVDENTFYYQLESVDDSSQCSFYSSDLEIDMISNETEDDVYRSKHNEYYKLLIKRYAMGIVYFLILFGVLFDLILSFYELCNVEFDFPIGLLILDGIISICVAVCIASVRFPLGYIRERRRQ